MKQKTIIAIVAAIVVLGGAYWYVSHHKASAPTETNIQTQNASDQDYAGDVPADSTDNTGVPSTATVAVSTQLPGDSVTIDNVYLEKPGFVTIHEVTSKGMAGNIIGTSGLLSAGAKQDLEIKAPLKPGAKYIAMLRLDDGDKKFNAQSDAAVTNKNIPVMTMFSVSQ